MSMSMTKQQKPGNKKNDTKFIFVVGGVMSGVGKGISTASIGQILQARGYRVSAMKIDPYINVDAGNMDPIEHGEVFVTVDGDQTDQDIGNYERFLNTDIYQENYMTTGRVYQTVIAKERNLEYKGRCVQVVPHIPLEVCDRIDRAVEKTGAQIMIIEIGGTVGEYENLLFLEAARVMKLYQPKNVLFVMVSYLPIPNIIGEMKTKPTQHAVRNLQGAGIQPDFLIARSEKAIDSQRREKLSLNCNIAPENVISAPDADSIYDIPLNFEKNGLSTSILDKFGLAVGKLKNEKWLEMLKKTKLKGPEVNIAIVGKYFESGDFKLSDSYISVKEAIKHASAYNNCKTNIHCFSSEEIEKKGVSLLKNLDGVIIPQGQGKYGFSGELKAITYCRKNNIPYFGLCNGMNMALIEFAREVAGLKGANSTDIDPKTSHPLVHFRPYNKESDSKQGIDGNLRLGAWPCKLEEGTLLFKAYKNLGKGKIVHERHRHSLEFNNDYLEKLREFGLVISGSSPDGSLVEAIELKDHPFFVAVSFHPEYSSRPLDPHPLFIEFIKAAKKISKA